MRNAEILAAQAQPLGTVKPGMTRQQKIISSILLIIILSLCAFLFVSTDQVKKLAAEGKGYYTIVPGSPGINGQSAYELAVDRGYRGSEDDWLKTLKGDMGSNGLNSYELAQIQGYLGNQSDWLNSLVGAKGKSAYEAAQAEGFEGSQLEWLASLIGAKGEKGDQGSPGDAGASAYTIAVINGFEGSQQQWLASLKGVDGTNGRDTFISCVTRDDSNYVAWKYTDEENSAYRDIYKIPVWATCSNAIDLKTPTP